MQAYFNIAYALLGGLTILECHFVLRKTTVTHLLPGTNQDSMPSNYQSVSKIKQLIQQPVFQTNACQTCQLTKLSNLSSQDSPAPVTYAPYVALLPYQLSAFDEEMTAAICEDDVYKCPFPGTASSLLIFQYGRCHICQEMKMVNNEKIMHLLRHHNLSVEQYIRFGGTLIYHPPII